MKENNAVKTIVAIGIGSALFFVLGRFVAIPTPIPNTNFNIQYAVLALFAVIYGPVSGMLIGLIGHTLIDISFGSPWWSWIIASAVVGLIIGFAGKGLDVESGEFGTGKIVKFNLIQIIAIALAFLLVAPGLDVVIYAEPAAKVFAQGALAAVMNIVTTGIVGSLLLLAYAKTRTQKGSLSKE